MLNTIKDTEIKFSLSAMPIVNLKTYIINLLLIKCIQVYKKSYFLNIYLQLFSAF